MLRLMQRLGKPFFQFIRGEQLSWAENFLLTMPNDSIPIDCFPRSIGRLARSAAIAAAKPQDL